MQKHLLTDQASQILHILSRMDEMQNRMVREKEERQKLLEMRRKAQEGEAQEPANKTKGLKPCIRPGNKGRPLSPSVRIPKNGWKMTVLDCPHIWDRLDRKRENASARWITCLDCGSRWDRIHGEDDYLDNLGIPLKMNLVEPEKCAVCNSKMSLRRCPRKLEQFWACERFPKCKAFIRTMLDAEEMEVEAKASTKQRQKDKTESKTSSCSHAPSAPSHRPTKRGTKNKEAPADEDDMTWEWDKA